MIGFIFRRRPPRPHPPASGGGRKWLLLAIICTVALMTMLAVAMESCNSAKQRGRETERQWQQEGRPYHRPGDPGHPN